MDDIVIINIKIIPENIHIGVLILRFISSSIGISSLKKKLSQFVHFDMNFFF